MSGKLVEIFEYEGVQAYIHMQDDINEFISDKNLIDIKISESYGLEFHMTVLVIYTGKDASYNISYG